MKKIYYIFLVLLIVFPLTAYKAHSGETPISARLKLYGTYVDNVFQTSLPESDYISLTYLDASYGITPEASVFYNANLNLFSEHSDLHTHNHHLGVDYEREVFQSNGLWYLGGKLGIRQNAPGYDLYDQRNGSAYTGMKYYLTESLLGKMGYGVGYVDCPNYQEFNFLKNYGFLELSKFFQSRTTLQFGLDLERREYLNLSSDNTRNYANQITGSAKIAQSLADSTGLQLQYSWHHATQNIVDDEYLEDDYYLFEDFFEDEYDYSGQEYRVTLKHLGSWDTMLKGTISRQSRMYNFPYTYLVDEKREDSSITLFLEVEKKFSFSFFPDFALHLQFLHKKNRSNDQYYDYSANMISIGTKATF